MNEVSRESIRSSVDSSIAVVYHRFTSHCKDENKDKIFCFFEGKDAPYYSIRVKHYFNDNYINFTCKNKSNVIKLYNKIKNHREDFTLGFFIDKDFDIPISNDDFYETPYYSIENFYITEYCLKNILKNEFYINDGDPEFNKIIDFFNEQLTIYLNNILYFNAWYYSLKCKKQSENLLSTNVSLDDKLPNDFLHLEIGNISSNYDYEKIQNKFTNAISVTVDEVDISLNFLKSTELRNSLRGKYLIHFLIAFCDFLVLDSKNSKQYIQNNINFQTNKNIILSHFSNYAFTPDCLENYLYKLNNNSA